ncbi:Dabb family protein [Amnibacterium sp. CER49]|uniref:Dabb family protein n=1 Tax=Amnibacterium sp. CER49 TaxID=3039161 RepID=UPI00244BD036|nr:Dabb family protein [Amnibacterium sp. CER49]MDH2444270.1 Dabb family protein [Amnibacterium sp. CER49]
MTALETDPGYKPGDVVHIVLFRLRDDATDADRAEVERRFRALADSEREGRRYIRRIRSGPQTSPEGVGRGLELGFVVEFASEGDRNYYLGRPFVGEGVPFDEPHDAFKAFVGPLLAEDGVLVFDFDADHDGGPAGAGWNEEERR